MYLDRVIYPVTALGPGNRVAIWTVGCNRKCEGCANPELWNRHPEQYITADKLAEYLNAMKDKGIDGITLTGGEPFYQADEIITMLDKLSFEAEVMAFSGYKLEEIMADPTMKKLLDRIDVLIDGEYIEKLNDGVSALRGSTNQTIHFLNPDVKDRYMEYMAEGRKIQNFMYDYKTVSVGIHNPSKTFREE